MYFIYVCGKKGKISNKLNISGKCVELDMSSCGDNVDVLLVFLQYQSFLCVKCFNGVLRLFSIIPKTGFLNIVRKRACNRVEVVFVFRLNQKTEFIPLCIYLNLIKSPGTTIIQLVYNNFRRLIQLCIKCPSRTQRSAEVIGLYLDPGLKLKEV